MLLSSAEPNLRQIKRAKHSSDLAHVISCLKALGVVTEPTEQFINAFARLNNEVRLVRIDWVHNGGKAVKSEFVEHTNGLTMNNYQIDISVDYIEEATDLMWLLSTEITKSARANLGGS